MQVNNFRLSADGKTEPVYLCRCGIEHYGDYAAEDYNHHMCFHDAPLWDIGFDTFICSNCGKGFVVKPKQARSESTVKGE